jgi:lipopolysaccharide export system protein LptC
MKKEMTKAEKLTKKYGAEFETLIHAVVADSEEMRCSNCRYYFSGISICAYDKRGIRHYSNLSKQVKPNNYCDNFKQK